MFDTNTDGDCKQQTAVSLERRLAALSPAQIRALYVVIRLLLELPHQLLEVAVYQMVNGIADKTRQPRHLRREYLS